MEKYFTLARENQGKFSAVLKVFGVGGGGCNALNYMIKKGLEGVEYVAVNTDVQALDTSSAHRTVQIGMNITKGLGAGADPEIGKKALEEDREKISKAIEGADMIFIAAGMGGGTGTGAAPLIASIARNLGVLVVGIVTKPFKWEGKKRMMNAEQGIDELSQFVDSLIVIPNYKLLTLIDKGTTALDAFEKPNEVLLQATRGIADIITTTGIINVDFADVKSVMLKGGSALMGIGVAEGTNRAVQAAQNAISSPLLEGLDIRGAKKLLLNVTSSSNMTMEEIETANDIVFKAVGDQADIIFGWVRNDDLQDQISYTVIATGFNAQEVALPNNSTNASVSNNASSGFVAGNQSNTNVMNEAILEPVQARQVANSDIKSSPVMRTTSEDLSKPTYLRNQGVEPIFSSVGFKMESATDYVDDFPEQDFKMDEEDSSTFLRRMMD